MICFLFSIPTESDWTVACSCYVWMAQGIYEWTWIQKCGRRFSRREPDSTETKWQLQKQIGCKEDFLGTCNDLLMLTEMFPFSQFTRDNTCTMGYQTNHCLLTTSDTNTAATIWQKNGILLDLFCWSWIETLFYGWHHTCYVQFSHTVNSCIRFPYNCSGTYSMKLQ